MISDSRQLDTRCSKMPNLSTDMVGSLARVIKYDYSYHADILSRRHR